MKFTLTTIYLYTVNICCITIVIYIIYSGAPRARVGGAPQLGKSTHPRKLAKQVTVHHPSGPALLRF